MKSCEPLLPPPSISFLLVGLLSGLGGLALNYLDGGRLDDSDSHGLPHVTDSEPDKRKNDRNGRKVSIIRTQ